MSGRAEANGKESRQSASVAAAVDGSRVCVPSGFGVFRLNGPGCCMVASLILGVFRRVFL